MRRTCRDQVPRLRNRCCTQALHLSLPHTRSRCPPLLPLQWSRVADAPGPHARGKPLAADEIALAPFS